MSKTWQKCRDAIDGQDAIKSKRHEYLPDLRAGGGQAVYSFDGKMYSDQVYETKLKLANYENIPASTISKYIDMAMRKPYTINLIESDDSDETLRKEMYSKKAHIVDSCFRSIGRTINAIEWMMREYCATGRFALLIKLPRGAQSTPANKAQEEALKRMVKQDPFFLLFKAEQILDWRENIGDDGFRYLEYVKLRVSDNNDSQDQRAIFYRRTEARAIETATGTINDDWTNTIGEQSQLEWSSISGIDKIPIVICGGVDPQRPPMADLVDIAITHYQTLSNLAFRQHATVSDLVVIETPEPTLPAGAIGQRKTNCKEDEEIPPKANEPGSILELATGKTAHILNSNARFDSYETRLDKLKQSMADMGAISISLNENRSGRETATAYESRISVQTSNIKNMIEAIQSVLDDSFDIAGRWARIQDLLGAPLLLNTDLVYTGWQSVKELIEAKTGGLISRESAVQKMHELDLYPESVTAAAEIKRLEEDDEEVSIVEKEKIIE